MKLEYAEGLYAALKDAQVDFVAYLPDDQLHELQKMVLERGEIACVPATNEAEALALCSGAWFGGKRPAAIIADSGLLVSTWALGSMLVSYGIPALVVIGHRGAVGDEANWRFYLYNRATKPILDGLQVPYISATTLGEAAEAFRGAQVSSTLWQHPVAVLLSGEVLRD
jgi:sulfopyruvate decarboxylase subunit alpha